LAPLTGVERIEAPRKIGTGTLDERPAVALDHRDRGSHDPRKPKD
jgi:hypothetical protein